MSKKINGLAVAALITLSVLSISIAPAGAQPGNSTNGVLLEEWRYDMHWYCWGYYGSSPAIADLGVNNNGSEPDSDLEIVTGSDECWGPDLLSAGVWRTFDSGGNLEWQRGTQTDEARSSPVIVDLDGDGDLEIAGGTTSGWYFEVMDHQGNFVWTFPKLTGFHIGGPFVWPSSPAAADLDPGESGLELVIGNRWLGNVWAFDGDNSDGADSGIMIFPGNFPWSYTSPLGTEGTDWDVLWKFPLNGSIGEIYGTPAIGDVDNDGALEVVIGSTDGNVYILNGADGSLEHTFSTGGGVYASAALANLDADACIEIIIGSTDCNVYCLQWDGTTGSTEWTISTGGAVYSSAAVGDVDGDGSLEIVVGSNDGNVYSISTSGSMEWSYATGGAVYSSPALADRYVGTYDMDWPMFRHDVRRTGYYGAAPLTGLDIYVGSDDCYLYLLDGSDGSMIDRFQTYNGTSCDGVRTSPSIADVDGDDKLEIFFYDWGQGSAHGGHTFWALEDTGSGPCVYVCNVFLTPNKLNVGRNAEHTFKVHVYPCEPMDVSVGDTAVVYIDVDASGTFDDGEIYDAVVSSTDVDGAATDIAVKVCCPDLIDNDPFVAIYSINDIPITYPDGSDIDDLQLDTFTPNGKQ